MEEIWIPSERNLVKSLMRFSACFFESFAAMCQNRLVKTLTRCLFVTVFAVRMALGASPPTDNAVMLAAVSRDESMLRGGIAGGHRLPPGKVEVEPLARITESGDWQAIECNGEGAGCKKFEREYLRKAHNYTVITADGSDVTVHSEPTNLSECFDYSGAGGYSGGMISNSAIAASSGKFFGEMDSPRTDRNFQSEVRHSVERALADRKVDYPKGLKILRVQLEGRQLVVMQRAFSDAPANEERTKLIFAIGELEKRRLLIRHWKKNIEDENERVLGTIRLKSGRDFLVTVVSDPESHFYRVYGIRDGRVEIVFSGGGSSC